MLFWTRLRVLHLAVAAVVAGSLATAAVAAAHIGPAGHGFRGHRYYTATGWVSPSSNATTLAVTNAGGKVSKFAVSTTTKYTYANGKAATAANATPGAVVTVRATAPTSKGANPAAKSVTIQLARISGLVKSDSAGTLSVVDAQGFTRTIDTGSSTTCSQPRHTKVNCSSIAAGSIVTAVGTVASNGTALDATAVQVAPARS